MSAAEILAWLAELGPSPDREKLLRAAGMIGASAFEARHQEQRDVVQDALTNLTETNLRRGLVGALLLLREIAQGGGGCTYCSCPACQRDRERRAAAAPSTGSPL